ncbi:MAG: DUF2235 domain-containing protein [Pseudanabaena sp.]|nr:MAG: DUF2235 domain-containing protein [Pseudanabaena sp.]
MKRLIVCCDGTWLNLDSSGASNVVKITQSIRKIDDQGVQQIVFYDEGIGAEDNFIDRIGGGAFGWGIDQKIESAYRFLSLNYEEGDEIYLFGFSRGAYTIRCLAGFIYCSGLLKRQYIRKTTEAYQLYRDRDPSKKPSSKIAISFRENYGNHVPIRAICCWDTVGALGVPDLVPFLPFDDWNNKKYEFFDTKLNRLIQNAFHAVAIDEIRKSFQSTPMERSDGADTNIRQLWFVGDHGCVGGGTDSTSGLSDITLNWIMENVENLGLAIDRRYLEAKLNPRFDIPFDNQPTGIFKLDGRVSRLVKDDASVLHGSVKQRWQAVPSYRPKNISHLRQFLDS